MKIAFWSNVHGQTGTTSNLLAIAVMSTLQFQLKNMVTQTHFNLNNLEAALIPISETCAKELFVEVGIDALARSLKSSLLDYEIIENCSISLLNKQLNLLPGTTKSNREIYENDINKTITRILLAAERCHDLVFIDTNSGNNELTLRILQEADLVVVNLSQNKSILEEYAGNHDFISKKVFYIIGNYDCNSHYSLKNIRKSYPWLKESNTAVIPYNTEYMDAQSDGQVIPFMLRNMDCGPEDSNAYFMIEVKKAVNLIMKSTGIERR